MKINLTLPHSWEELSDKQLLFVSSLFLQGITRNTFLSKAFICLSGLKILPGRYGDPDNPDYLFKNYRKQTFSLSLGEMLDFICGCDFLLQDRYNFRPLPELAGRKARDTMMYDACFGEFIAAMVYYNQFKDPQRDQQFLYKLCAVLYPAGTWNPDHIGENDFSGLDMPHCYTAFLWFGTIMNVVVRECPDLFMEASEDTEPVSLRENVHAMYNLVTGNDITKEKEISGMEMWRVLYDMDEKVKKIKEMNESIEQHGKF